MDPKPNPAPFGATQPQTTSSPPISTLPSSNTPLPIQPATAPQVLNQQPQNNTPTIVTVLLLIFLPPIGVIVMWLWPKWKVWVKVLVTIVPVLLMFVVGTLLSITLVAINPARQFKLANNTARKEYTRSISKAIDGLKLQNQGQFPPEVASSLPVGVPVPLASASGPGIITLCEYLTGVRGNEQYMSRLPIDPLVDKSYSTWKNCQNFDTGFVLIESGAPGSPITVEAPLMEKVEEYKTSGVSPVLQQ